MWAKAKEWWDAALISSVSASCFRGRAGCPSIRAKGNTCRLCIPVCLCGDPSVFWQQCCSLLLCQVSFCWKSRGCWKRQRWQRKLRASTVGSLMWCLVQHTCSGECLIRFFFFIWDDIHSPCTRNWIHFIFCSWDGWATVFHGCLLSAWFIRGLTLLLSQCDLLGCTLYSASFAAVAARQPLVCLTVLCSYVSSYAPSPAPPLFSVGPGSYLEICFQISAWLSWWAWAT